MTIYFGGIVIGIRSNASIGLSQFIEFFEADEFNRYSEILQSIQDGFAIKTIEAMNINCRICIICIGLLEGEVDFFVGGIVGDCVHGVFSF